MEEMRYKLNIQEMQDSQPNKEVPPKRQKGDRKRRMEGQSHQPQTSFTGGHGKSS